MISKQNMLGVGLMALALAVPTLASAEQSPSQLCDGNKAEKQPSAERSEQSADKSQKKPEEKRDNKSNEKTERDPSGKQS